MFSGESLTKSIIFFHYMNIALPFCHYYEQLIISRLLVFRFLYLLPVLCNTTFSQTTVLIKTFLTQHPLLLLSDKTKTGNPTIVQLAKGSVEEVKNIKGHDHTLKLTSTLQGERSVYLSFTDEKDYNKWIRKTKKVRFLFQNVYAFRICKCLQI